jgi:hypothetical protein
LLTDSQFYCILLILMSPGTIQFHNTASANPLVFATTSYLDVRFVPDIEVVPIRQNATNNEFPFDIQPLPSLSGVVEKARNLLTSNNLPLIFPLLLVAVSLLWLFKHLPRRIYDAKPMTVWNLLMVYASLLVGVLVILAMQASSAFTGTVIQQLGILSASIVFPAVIISLINRRAEQYGIKLIIIGLVLFIASIIMNNFIQL